MMDIQKINEKDEYTVNQIGDKSIFIFENHNMALPVWGEYSKQINQTCQLIAFDFHSDTLPVFNAYLSPLDDITKKINSNFLNNIKETNRNSFDFECVYNLANNYIRNDEHIKAAYDWNYISRFIVVTSDKYFTDNEIYDLADGYSCCYLSKENWINGIKVKEPTVPYILDFDLDYFNSADDLPIDTNNELKKLIKNCEIITIAKEPKYFEECKKDKRDNNFSNEYVLKHLVDFITKSLN